jgi:hypothetical protein
MSETRTGDALRYDSTTATNVGGDEQHSIQTYISDMIALEKHIAQPLDKQINDSDAAQFPEALAVFTEIKSIVDRHVAVLETRLAAIGGHEASGLKEAFASLFGGAAASIGGSRKTKVSKWLRDDHTALSLATISFTMLNVTALGLGDTATADIAKQGLADLAPVVVRIGRTIPGVVLQELRDQGLNVTLTAEQYAQQNQEDAWNRGSVN